MSRKQIIGWALATAAFVAVAALISNITVRIDLPTANTMNTAP